MQRDHVIVGVFLSGVFTQGTVTQRRDEGGGSQGPWPQAAPLPTLVPPRSCRNLRTQADAHHVSSRTGREPEAAEWSPVLLQAEGPVEDQP